MEITLTQRLILVNQYELMALLDEPNAAKYKRMQRIIQGGYKLEMKELYKDFSELSEEECNTVRDTLEMYQALQVSYNNLADKGDLTAHRLKFLGYCGIREKKYLNYLGFVAQTDKNYRELVQCPNGCDAQTPMWDKYVKMLDIWNQCPRKFHLSLAEIKQVLNA
ncbi:YfbU family protein [Pasteurellaceae bacterium 20609_3]|uniref:YfbU family protein n=1 Tax=Spirabiliibacterium mucosae TaxID=28156 RepID=UPI001AADFFE1|nr:YfbU family protein [Spirabiliibacterium mucosae]MBE2897397.1 YfbU family protein [Spirabiliibacterium mucosae]